MSKKPIIVFEGIEGSGKSHHIKVISKFLDKKKVDSYIKKSLKQKNPGNDQFLMMLITIDQFIKVIK